MKYLLIIIACLTFSCSKENDVIVEQAENINTLTQHLDGVTTVNYGYLLAIYEQNSSGEFKEVLLREYTNDVLPKIFKNVIERPFYFIITLKNTSLYVPTEKGNLIVTVNWQNQHVITLTVDSNTFENSYQSPILNN